LSCSQVLLPLISIPYISRVLLPDGIGRVSFIDSLSYYFVAIAEFGIAAYGVREVARTQADKDKLNKLVSELVALHCITSAISLVFYCITVYILWQKIGDIRLVWFSIAFLVANFFSCEWYYMGIEKFRYIMQRSLISRLLGLAAIFILVKEPKDYFIYYGIITFAAIINLTTNTVILFRHLHISFKNIRWRLHLQHTKITYLISLFYGVTVVLDNVLLGMVSTATAVGLYAMSARIVRLAANLITDMFQVLFPRTVALIHEKKEKELEQTFLKSVQIITLLTIPAGTGIFLLALPLVQTILSERFYAASLNLEILAILPFIKTYSLFLGKQVLMSHGWERKYLFALVAGALIFVASTLVLSWYFHQAGACYALIVAEAAVLAICYYQVKKAMPRLAIIDYRTLLQSVVAAAVFVPVIWLIQNYIASPILVVLISLAVCVPVYFAIQAFVMKNQLLLDLYRSGKTMLHP
jgi:Membrane protein involved in the export of O-antigen and teichoic acid